MLCIDCGEPLNIPPGVSRRGPVKKYCSQCLALRATASRQNARASKLGLDGSFTWQEWVDLCNQYGNVCLRCGWDGPLTPDHVIPLDKQGINDIGNIQPLCLRCNRRKRTGTVDYRNECLDVRLARWECERILREKRAEQDAIRLATRPRLRAFSIQLNAHGNPTGIFRFSDWIDTSPVEPGEQWVTIEATDIDELQEKMKLFR